MTRRRRSSKDRERHSTTQAKGFVGGERRGRIMAPKLPWDTVRRRPRRRRWRQTSKAKRVTFLTAVDSGPHRLNCSSCPMPMSYFRRHAPKASRASSCCPAWLRCNSLDTREAPKFDREATRTSTSYPGGSQKVDYVHLTHDCLDGPRHMGHLQLRPNNLGDSSVEPDRHVA